MPKRILLGLILAWMMAATALGQQNRIIPVEDWTYEYIKRLQRRGHLLSLHPTALPYRQGEVAEALAALDREGLSAVEQRWVDLLEEELSPVAAEADEFVFGVTVDGGVIGTNNERLDPLRPLDDTAHLFEHFSLQLRIDRGPFIGQVGARHHLFYDDDPDGLDSANRLIARSQDAYVGYHSRFASLYLGRYSNLWGRHGEAAAVISENPRSYDRLTLRLGGERIALRSIVGELDSITGDGRFTGTAGDDSVAVGSERRYVAAHRFDWRPSKHLSFALVESALFSGQNAGFSLKYLNPVQAFIFAVDNRPKNEENNGMFAGMMWAQFDRVTLHGQLMFDDFDALANSEKTSFALIGSLHLAAVRPNMDLGGTLEVISARTYNTIQPEGRYLYLLRGLATQFSDYIHASAFADLYLDSALPGLILTPRLHILSQGERDIRQPFPLKTDDVSAILDGTIERTVRPAVQVFYQRVPWWWLRLDVGANFISNKGHVEGVSETKFVGLIEVGARFSLDKAYKLKR